MDEERTLKRMTAFGTMDGVLDQTEEHIYLKRRFEITIFVVQIMEYCVKS